MALTEQDRQEALDLLVHIEQLLGETNDAATVNQVAKQLAAVVDSLKSEDAEALERKSSRRPRLNGGEQIDPIALLAGALSVNAIAAVLADLEMSNQPSAK